MTLSAQTLHSASSSSVERRGPWVAIKMAHFALHRERFLLWVVESSIAVTGP
jgi:hypothetical protein